jgi:enoyl-CoA hydratase/carnithine racemase
LHAAKKLAAHRALPTTTPFRGQKAHAFSLNVRFFSKRPQVLHAAKKLAAHRALPTTTPFRGQKAHAFSLNVRFFPSDPRSCTRPKKLAAHRALITQTTPFLADKRLTLFPLNVRFQATPDLARGLKPAAHRALTTTKQQINNQQQTTNATPKFLLIPRSVLLTLVTRDRTQGAVFSVTS